MRSKTTRDELLAAFKVRTQGVRLVATVSLAEGAQTLGISQGWASTLLRRAGIGLRARPQRYSRADVVRACRAQSDDGGTWRASTPDTQAGEVLGISRAHFRRLRLKYGVLALGTTARRHLTRRQIDQARKMAGTLPLREVALAVGVSVADLRQYGFTEDRVGRTRAEVLTAFKAREIAGRWVATATMIEAADALGVTAAGAHRILRKAGIAPRPRARKTRLEVIEACRARRGPDGTWRATVVDAHAASALGVGEAQVRALRKRDGVAAMGQSVETLSSKQLDAAQALAGSRSLASVARTYGVSVPYLYRNGVLPGHRDRRLRRRQLLRIFGARKSAGKLVAMARIAEVAQALGIKEKTASAIRDALGLAARQLRGRPRSTILEACRAQRGPDGSWRATVPDSEAAESLGMTPTGFGHQRRRHQIEPRRRWPSLSARELKLARELAQALPLTEVAAAFGVSTEQLRIQGVTRGSP